MARTKTWYVVKITCCNAEYRIANRYDPRRNKTGPRCKYCKVPVAKRRWKFFTTVPATTRAKALKLCEYLKTPKTHNRHRRCHPATPLQIDIAENGLSDLRTHYNKIALVPAPDAHHRGQKIRVIESSNIDWYVVFATQNRMNERPGRGRKRYRNYPPLRRQVKKALERIISGWIDPVARDEMLLEEIEESLQRRGWTPPKNDGELPF